jgi:hypothetical protein
MIEGFLIYAAVVGLAGYFVTRRAPTIGRKLIVWAILLLMTFPGFYLTLVFWSSIISAFSDGPLKH